MAGLINSLSTINLAADNNADGEGKMTVSFSGHIRAAGNITISCGEFELEGWIQATDSTILLTTSALVPINLGAYCCQPLLWLVIWRLPVGTLTRRGEIAVSQLEMRQLNASKLQIISPASSLISVGVTAKLDLDSLGVVELLGTSGQAAFSAGAGSYFRSLTTKVKATSHEIYLLPLVDWCCQVGNGITIDSAITTTYGDMFIDADANGLADSLDSLQIASGTMLDSAGSITLQVYSCTDPCQMPVADHFASASCSG